MADGRESKPIRGLDGFIMEHALAAIAVFDRDMLYLAHNARWVSDFGLLDDDLVGLSHYELFPEIEERWKEIYRRALDGKAIGSELDRIARADGAEEWIEWKIVPWRDRAGSVAGIVIFSHVLTKGVEAHRRAGILRKELDLLIDSARDHAICLLGPDGKVRLWNGGAERLFGIAEDEILGKLYDGLFSPALRAAGVPAEQLSEAAEIGSFSGRRTCLRGDETFEGQVAIAAIYDDGGNLIAFSQVVHDVSDDDARSLAAEASEAQMAAILSTVPDAMIVIDEQGIITAFSAAAERLFDYSASEAIGQNVSILMPSPDRENHDGHLARYRKTGERHIIGNNRRVFGRRKDGSIFPHELRVAEAAAGGKRLFTGFVCDLSEREASEMRFRALQVELEQISRVTALGTMATALAHELNQPLTATANYLQAAAALLKAKEGEGLATICTALDEASSEVLRAGSIIHRLREFLSRGELERTAERPEELARDACVLMIQRAGHDAIECEMALQDSLPAVLVDRVQVQQVLMNLVRNASEAMDDAGRIIISAETCDDMLRFTVSDDGPGVAPSDQEKLFRPFVSEKTGGMGLGLSICRTIIQAHGGKLWFEPAPAHGAAFHFTVPIVSEEVRHDC